MPEKTIIVIRETPVQSFLADCFTFVCIAVLLWLNHVYFGDHVFVAVILVFMALIFAANKGSKKVHKFTTKNEAIEFIKS
jgi:hypothetical protein